jgi:hypothetical protein
MGIRGAWADWWDCHRDIPPLFAKIISRKWFKSKFFNLTEWLDINPSPKKVTICASEAKPKQRGEAPVCTRNTIAKGKGDEED